MIERVLSEVERWDFCAKS